MAQRGAAPPVFERLNAGAWAPLVVPPGHGPDESTGPLPSTALTLHKTVRLVRTKGDSVRDVTVEDPKDLVRRGYDALSVRYDEAYDSDSKYRSWTESLNARLSDGCEVLDLGCGSGVPVVRDLVAAGHHVTGVDISDMQVRRARELVPRAEFIRADATSVDFPAESFDAVVFLYALIHIPLEEQRPLLENIASWLRPGGLLLCSTGRHEWTGVDEDWLGSGVAMWWSHADADTNRAWIAAAGLTVEQEEFVPEGDGGHVLFWARRPD
jgi:SAM-dependent methyltransferase